MFNTASSQFERGMWNFRFLVSNSGWKCAIADSVKSPVEAGSDRKLSIVWWARGDSNARPLPCQGSALNPLSFAAPFAHTWPTFRRARRAAHSIGLEGVRRRGARIRRRLASLPSGSETGDSLVGIEHFQRFRLSSFHSVPIWGPAQRARPSTWEHRNSLAISRLGLTDRGFIPEWVEVHRNYSRDGLKFGD